MNKSNSALKAWREKHLLLADTILTLSVIAGFTAVSIYGGFTEDLSHALDERRSALYTTIAAITGSLLGFVLTAISIIAAFLQLPRFTQLRKSRALPDLFKIYFRTAQVLAMTTIWSIFGLIVDTDASQLWCVTLTTASLAALAITFIYRCIWVLERVVDIAVQPLDDTQPN